MCYPLAIAAISMAASAASAAAGQKNAQQQMNQAGEAANLQNQQLAKQMDQVNQQATQESFERRRQTDRELGKFMAAAGASGVTGVSIGRQQSAATTNEGIALGTLATNRDNRLQQAGIQGLQIQSQFRGRVNEAAASAKSPLESVLGIAGAGVSGYSTGLSIKNSLAART